MTTHIFICDQCGLSFERELSSNEYHMKFCSRGCMHEFQKGRNMFGPKLPQEYWLFKWVFKIHTRRIRGESTLETPIIYREVPDRIKYGETCCEILKSHAEVLKNDPERLTTDFIKKLSKCECKDD